MKRKVLIIITLFSIISIPFINLSINIYTDETVKSDIERIAADVDSHDVFYLNQSHQIDFVFLADHTISLFPPQDTPFEDNFMPHKTSSFIEFPYKPPLPRA